MNRSQALKEAVRIWGKRAMVRDSGKPTSELARTEASTRLSLAREAYNEKGITLEEKRARRSELDAALGAALRYRYSVGYGLTIPGFGLCGFSVQGQGDTWEEAFAKARKREAA